MPMKPTLCGRNSTNLPESGCSDCDALEYRIEQLEKWVEDFEEEGYNALANKPTINGVTVEGDKSSEDYLITAIPENNIIALTPIECYVPPCQDSRACYGEACCMIVGCNTSTDSTVCVGGVCYMEVACDEPEPPEHNPSMVVEIEVDMPTHAEGDEYEVGFYLYNTGDVALSNITLSSVFADGEWTISNLPIGGSEGQTVTMTITAEDISVGSITIDASASCTYDGTAVTASASKIVSLSGEDE